MPGSFAFFEATDDERRLLTSRAAILDLPRELAAEPNSNRRVWRILHRGRTWFFKEFGQTSLKNRWRFRRTPPHAIDDAEREALMTLSLRAEGIETPRPVLRGHDERGSFYLCALMPGQSLRARLQTGAIPRGTGALVAGFCGEVLKKGFWLPDLSAEHVFVRQEIAFLHFGLLDLHNGLRMPAGPPPMWLCRRVLTHFARSVHDLAIPRIQAIRFAARLLKNAGRGGDTRRLLRKVPVLDTAWRYEQAGKAKSYADRNPQRTARELALLAQVWPGRAGESVLDVPCGAGRLLPFLREREHRVFWADGALAMVQEARSRQDQPVAAVQAHALALPFADRSLDGVVQFRFLHHLPRPAMKTAVQEACRVARRFVVVSFFHPCSLHHLQRRTKERLLGRAPRRFAVTLGNLDKLLHKHGFVRTAVTAEGRFTRDLWIASYERR